MSCNPSLWWCVWVIPDLVRLVQNHKDTHTRGICYMYTYMYMQYTYSLDFQALSLP